MRDLVCRTVVAIGLVVALLSGCASQRLAVGRGSVSQHVCERTGHSLARDGVAGVVVLPNGASVDDGLDEDESVLIALWNNAAFQELLVELRIAHSDLIQAGLLPNPEVAYFFHVPGKPFRYAIEMPLEALFLRPVRLAAAGRESQRVVQQLTQAALDLIRDVRQSYADVRLAQGRLEIADESVRLRSSIEKLAQRRLAAGDISVQEAAAARIDALQARQERVRFAHDVPVAEERLRQLLGLGGLRTTLVLNMPPLPKRSVVEADVLAAEAVENRPDALAVEHAAASAAERARLARRSWLRYLGILDATSGNITGHEFGPGFRLTLPIFNQNQGAIARAGAELERAARQRRTVRHRIVMEVRQAYQRYRQALAELMFFEENLRPELDAAMRRAEEAFREGETSYIVVLETSRRLLDGRSREVQLHAELRRTWAELERSVGRRLDDCVLVRQFRADRPYEGGQP